MSDSAKLNLIALLISLGFEINTFDEQVIIITKDQEYLIEILSRTENEFFVVIREVHVLGRDNDFAFIGGVRIKLNLETWEISLQIGKEKFVIKQSVNEEKESKLIVTQKDD